MSMSERELEEMRRLANEAYRQPVAARYERTLAKYLLSAVDEVRRSHTEAAELRERVESLDDAIRDMLDWATGFCRPTTDKEKLEAIEEIGGAALRQEQAKLEMRREEEK